MPYLLWDNTYILVLIGILLCALASGRVKSTYSKYSRVQSRSGLTGAELSQRMLERAGIFGVQIERIEGNLTDHYDPRTKVLRLSASVYSESSVAALSVAAHECGHAIQDNEEYTPLRLRNVFVPVANFGSTLSFPVIIAGLIFSIQPLITVGIVLFSFAVIFQLITLPVEFNASGRALATMRDTGVLYGEENDMAKKVLGAAALTYVAGTLATLLQLLRLLILFGGRRRK